MLTTMKFDQLVFCLFNSGKTRILVGPGATNVQTNATSQDSEVLDLSDSSLKCDTLPPFPIRTIGAVGGSQFDNLPIICGQNLNTSSNAYICHHFKRGRWEFSPIQITHDIGKLPAYADYPASQFRFKLFTHGKWRQGLKFDAFTEETRVPEFAEGMCATFLDEERVIVLGTGVNRTKVYVQNTTLNQAFVPLPDTMFPHPRAGCGKIREDQLNTAPVIIVVGGDGQLSTEFLFNLTEWRTGPGLSCSFL